MREGGRGGAYLSHVLLSKMVHQGSGCNGLARARLEG